MTALELAQKLKHRFGDLLSEPSEFRAEITLKLLDAERIAEVCGFAKKELDFDYLVDITAVDWPKRVISIDVTPTLVSMRRSDVFFSFVSWTNEVERPARTNSAASESSATASSK